MLGESQLTVSLFEGTINSDTFEGWIEQDLLPKQPPSSVIIMDNAPFHKKATTKELIDKVGHILEFLPPYSPDLNPIEHKWAQAKAIRKNIIVLSMNYLWCIAHDQFIWLTFYCFLSLNEV